MDTTESAGFDQKSGIDNFDLSEVQKAKWKKLVEIHGKLATAVNFIGGSTTDINVKDALMNATESLRRTQYLLEPEIYNLVFLGSSGQGKSTILNVLMGRDILPTGDGAAITGAVIFIEAADENSPERAIIEYCTPEELKKQVIELLKLAEIKNTEKLLGIFDDPNPSENDFRDLLNRLEELHKDASVTSATRNNRTLIWDILNSYKNYWREIRRETCDTVQKRRLTKEFRIPEDLKKLRDIINESQNYFDTSSLKDLSNTTRVIRLIAHVTCYVHPSKSGYMGKLLKNNIRVVDVPGFGENNPVHEILTKNLVRTMEPMFALVTATDRIAMDPTKNVFEWVHNNYIAIAGDDRDLIRSVSESIFIIANNRSNINLEAKNRSSDVGDTNSNENSKITVKNIETIDTAVNNLIKEYISPEYLYHFKGRGSNAKPYILVTPLSMAYIQHQYDQIDADKLDGCYQMFSKSLNISPYFGPEEKDKYIMERTGIPNLTEQFFSFLVNRRIDTQVERACKYLQKGVDGLGVAIKDVVGEVDLTDPNIRAKQVLDSKEEEFKELLSEIRRELFFEFGKDNDPVKPFVGMFKRSLEYAKKDLENRVNNFDIEKHIKITVNPITGVETIQTTRGDLGIVIDSDIQERFRAYAKQFADELLTYFEFKLDKNGIRSKLNDITYGKKYEYIISQSGWGDIQKITDVTKIYKHHIDLFKSDYTEAFRILMVYELLRDNKRSAFSQLTSPVQTPDNNSDNDSKSSTQAAETTMDSSLVREEMDVISVQVQAIIKQVTEILDDSPTNPLFLGLRKHFFYLYIRLKGELEAAYRKVVSHHLAMTDSDLIKIILERDNAYEDERVKLSGALTELWGIHDELSDLC